MRLATVWHADAPTMALVHRDQVLNLKGAVAALVSSTLAARLGATRSTVQRVYEPFLLRRGLVRLTPRGRCLGGAVAKAA